MTGSFWWDLLIGIGAALLLAWLVLVLLLLIARPRGGLLREALRVLPDVLRLVRAARTSRQFDGAFEAHADAPQSDPLQVRGPTRGPDFRVTPAILGWRCSATHPTLDDPPQAGPAPLPDRPRASARQLQLAHPSRQA